LEAAFSEYSKTVLFERKPGKKHRIQIANDWIQEFLPAVKQRICRKRVRDVIGALSISDAFEFLVETLASAADEGGLVVSSSALLSFSAIYILRIGLDAFCGADSDN